MHNLLINAGIYLFRPDVFKYIPSEGDIERKGFPELAMDKKLYGVIYTENHFCKSIDKINDKEVVGKYELEKFLFYI